MNREYDLSDWPHVHIFDEADLAAERSTRTVMLITVATMVVEIAAGWWFNSMALLADGWHMSSHALAIGLSSVAYMASRRYARDPRFAFGTWKIEVLAGYSSALFLLVIAAWMVIGSVERLLAPQPIRFAEAIAVAAIGLLVNVGCAVILGGTHAHHHHRHGDGDHEPHHAHRHHDLNLRAAYLHVVVDAATSVLAILALLGGMLFGWGWLDPAMGLVGAALVALWSRGLIRDTSHVLLDREMHHPVVAEVKDAIRSHPEWGPATRIADLHVWRIGRERYSCILSLTTDSDAVTPQAVKAALAQHEELAHITVEIDRTAARPLLGHRRIGHGDHAVLVLHEWLGDHANWDGLWPLVDRRRFSWICVDLRGYGWSRALPGRYDLDEAADDLLALTARLGIGRFDVVGHSMSALVAQRLAVLAPRRVRRLALVAPVPPTGLAVDGPTMAAMRALINDDEALRAAIVARTGGRRDAQWVDAKLRLARGAGSAEAMAGYLRMFTATDLSADVRGSAVPVLAVVGRHDIAAHREEAVRQAFAPLYADFSLAVSETSGHYMMLEDPAFLARALTDFFERV